MRYCPFVEETTTTTGTGTVTLAQVTGSIRFSDFYADGEAVPYTIQDGNNREWGIGTYTATNTLARTTVLGTLSSGTLNVLTPTALTLASGTKTVLCTNVAVQCAAPAIAASATNSYNFVAGTSSGTSTISADTIHYVPIDIIRPGVYSTMNMEVTAQIASSTGKMGVYATDAVGNPGVKLAETGSIDTSTTGLKPTSLTANVYLSPGWYYLAFVADAAIATRNRDSNSDPFVDHAGHSGSDFARANNYLSESTTSNALPSNATVGGEQVTDRVMMAIE